MKNQIQTPEYKVYYPLKNKKSKIEGTGAYALKEIPARKKIGDLGGVIISEREAIKRRRNVKQIAMVDLEDNLVLDASINPNELRYINHCCEPNSYIRVTKNRVEFYSLRKIKVGEELSADYGETHHHGTLPCRCGAKKCRGFI